MTETIHVGVLSLQFTCVAQPDRVLEEMETAAEKSRDDSPEIQPYWAQTWDSAVAMANVLCNRDVRGQSVLDLGCGMGLTGMVAAACGARVTMVDVAAPALLFARLNSWPWREQVNVRQFDWRTQHVDKRFDLILGSDILYDREDWPHLENFWHQHLQPSGQILLTEPGRRTGDEFVKWLNAQVWQLQSSKMQLTGKAPHVRLFDVSLRRAPA